MAPPPKGKPQPAASTTKANRRKKGKQPTQRTPQQRVKVVGADGKVRWEWREWPSKSG